MSKPDISRPFYQLKITLLNVEPPVWRRFVVPPDIPLYQLHEIILDVMGWDGEHMHSFTVGKTRKEQKNYLPDKACAGSNDIPEEDYVLKDLADRPGKKFTYLYDFGDDWKHEIIVEKTAYSDPKHPGEIRCLAGAGACPPEDCGGPYTYTQALYDWSEGDEIDNYILESTFKAKGFDPKRFDITEARKKLKKVLEFFKLDSKNNLDNTKKTKENSSTTVSPCDSAPKEIVQKALLSPIEAVRLGAAIWFSDDTNDVSVMKTVIESIERYGAESSLAILDKLILPQDETTVAWITSELDKNHDLEKVELDNYCWFFAEILTRSDSKLLNEKMVELRCSPKELKTIFLQRFELTKFTWEELWDSLTERIQNGDAICLYNLNLLREAMARHTDQKTEILDTLIERNDILKNLKKERKMRSDDLNDIKVILLDLIGDMRITEALPHILHELKVPLEEGQKKPKERIKLDISKKYFDDDNDEQSHLFYALSQIVDDRTLDRLYALWHEKPRRYNWFVDFLPGINTPKAYGIAIAMLKSEVLDSYDVEKLVEYLLRRCVEDVYPLIPELQEEMMEDFENRSDFVIAKLIHPGKSSDSKQEACFEKWRRELEKNDWELGVFHEEMQTERRRKEFDDDYTDDDYDYEE